MKHQKIVEKYPSQMWKSQTTLLIRIILFSSLQRLVITDYVVSSLFFPKISSCITFQMHFSTYDNK